MFKELKIKNKRSHHHILSIYIYIYKTKILIGWGGFLPCSYTLHAAFVSHHHIMLLNGVKVQEKWEQSIQLTMYSEVLY